MSKYKALFLDVDGTIVGDGVQLPHERIAEVLQKAQDQILITLATGRPLFAVKPLIQALHLKHPCVLGNGVFIYDPVSDSMIMEYPLPKERVGTIVEITTKKTANARFFDGEKDVDLEHLTQDANVYGIFIPEESEQVITELHREIEKVPDVHAHKGLYKQQYNLDITSAQASKLHGVSFVQHRYQLKKEECVAVGDGYNDFPLLLSCGLKIAMGNAVSELKEIADFICPPVDQDGVATVIEKILL